MLAESVMLLMLLLVSQADGLRCYMDSSDPSHPGYEDCMQVHGDGNGMQYLTIEVLLS